MHSAGRRSALSLSGWASSRGYCISDLSVRTDPGFSRSSRTGPPGRVGSRNGGTSLPPTMRTSSPFIRWYRAKISAGMNVETAWPRCRGPDAYGQATQTRIFAIRGGSKKRGSFKPFADEVFHPWSADGTGLDYHRLQVLANR